MRKVAFALVGVVVLGLLAILGIGVVRGANAPGLKTAPDFSLVSFDGERISLSSFRGEPVVLNFWASWCPSCRDEAATIEKASRDYRTQGVVFIGVDVSDGLADAQKFIKEFSIDYPNVPDYSGTVTTNYRVTTLPSTFFISRDGRIVKSYVGPITRQKLDGLVAQILK